MQIWIVNACFATGFGIEQVEQIIVSANCFCEDSHTAAVGCLEAAAAYGKAKGFAYIWGKRIYTVGDD